MLDRLRRPLRDLRISVTDRCNFRCRYCMPREAYRDHQFLPRGELLTFEEIDRLVQAATRLGVSKVRLTGGEPLLRAGLHRLVAMIRSHAGVTDLAMTTNASLLPRFADRLASSGLDRVSISLDALNDSTFRAMNDAEVGVVDVLTGIEAAAEAGLGPIKINAVVIKGVNDDQVVPLARYFRGTGHIVRFIEFMDVGASNSWDAHAVVSAAEILSTLDATFPIEPIAPAYPGEVARRFRYLDGMGEVGVIASVSQPFCGDCSRLRVSAEGVAFTCLFAHSGTDLRGLLRGPPGDDTTIEAAIASVWERRSDRYSELRRPDDDRRQRVEMPRMGG
jgi:cyclic pyranopterin phosphate synthase